MAGSIAIVYHRLSLSEIIYSSGQIFNNFSLPMDQCCKTILNGAIPDLFVFTYFFYQKAEIVFSPHFYKSENNFLLFAKIQKGNANTFRLFVFSISVTVRNFSTFQFLRGLSDNASHCAANTAGRRHKLPGAGGSGPGAGGLRLQIRDEGKLGFVPRPLCMHTGVLLI